MVKRSTCVWAGVLAIWFGMWVFDAGCLQARSKQFFHDLDRRFPGSINPAQTRRDVRTSAAANVAIATLGPMGVIVTFVVTGAYQDGWINPFTREFWND